MFDTMQAANGAGLAAPQIGVPLRVVIFGYADPEMRNPRYPDADPVPADDTGQSGIRTLVRCARGRMGRLPVGAGAARHRRALLQPALRGFDLDGRPIERVASGFHARVVQHECDHLDGILYPMRIKDFTRFGFAEVLFPELAGQPDD